LLVYANDGIRTRFPAEADILVRDFKAEALRAYRSGTCFFEGNSLETFPSECDPPGRAGLRKIVIWGDSLAAHLFPGMNAHAQRNPTVGVGQYTTKLCPPVLTPLALFGERCLSSNTFAVRKIALLKPDVVIMSARWGLYDKLVGDDVMKRTIKELHLMGVKRAVAVGQVPIWTRSTQRIRASQFRGNAWTIFHTAATQPRARNLEFVDPLTFVQHEQSKQLLERAGAIFVSSLATFCNEDGCLLVVPDGSGAPVTWDTNHLTTEGSEFFVKSNADALLGP